MSKRVYIAATSQHVGKTTCTLGIVSALKRRGVNVGYCKPVGQEFVDLGDLKVDKDALLFSKMMNFPLLAELHSPVIVGAGVTQAYLDNPSQFTFRDKILYAATELHKQHEVVVYEGTGHPGVGSVIDLSNADVANLLNSPVVMVVEGGIGNTIDRLNANLALFREQKADLMGVILNKVLPDKIEKVRHYVGMKLEEWGIPLLGILPYDDTLTYPIMETIRQCVHGKILLNGHNLDNRVENITSGALIEQKEFAKLHNLLLIVGHRRLESAIAGIEEISKHKQIEGSPLAGIIINGEGNFMDNFLDEFPCRDYIEKHGIPLVATNLDTYGSALRISRLEVKIHTRTPWKVERAIQLIQEHVDLDSLLGKL